MGAHELPASTAIPRLDVERMGSRYCTPYSLSDHTLSRHILNDFGPSQTGFLGTANVSPISPLDRRRRSGAGPINNNNRVDNEKIARGEDVRTTIMLRNIPNKMDQATLKEIVDETSHGQYDFMYLRIDFANNCNVGYAFINFVDPLAIVSFYRARAGRRWNKHKSHKEAEVSYATIQGKDCLIQKFRNSSVMLEHPSFRPKVCTFPKRPEPRL